MWLGQNMSLDYGYMISNLMGSAGKQDDSGDLDIAIDKFLFTREQFKALAAEGRKILGHDAVKTSLHQTNMAVPIYGNSQNGFIQVDLIYGKAEWLKFTHYSPGAASQFKGVFVSQTIGVLAKMKVLYRYPVDAVVDKDNGIDERLGEAAFAYDLERGLNVRCRLRMRGGFKPVSIDEFETKCKGPMTPHIPRYGYIDDPATAVRLVVHKDATIKDTETFEILLSFLYKKMSTEEWDMFKTRLLRSLLKSGARYFFEENELGEYLDSVE